MSSEVTLEVENNVQGSARRMPGSYDWGGIMQRRLCEIFPDLTVTLKDSEGKRVILAMSSANGPMYEEDIRSRIHDFMRIYPAMHVETLQIAAEAN